MIETPRRVAVVRLSAFGDVVFALPLAAALKRAFPEAEILWFVDERFADAVRAVEEVDRVFPLPLRRFRAGAFVRRPFAVVSEIRKLMREARATPIDVALDAQGNFKSGLVSLLSGAKIRVGYSGAFAREGNRLFSNRVVGGDPDRTLHATDHAARLLSALGLPTDVPTPTIRLPIPPETSSTATRRDEVRGPRRPFVVLLPGTSARMPHKRWPPLRYAELARRLVAYRNAEVSVVFGPDDRDVADEVVFAAEGAATLAPDLSGPIALGAYLRAADVVVGGDTGPVHWAAALGAPTIAIFGPTDPSRYHPRGRPDRALYRRAFCSPCRHRACPDRECLDLIDVGAVASAVLAALDEGRVEAAV